MSSVALAFDEWSVGYHQTMAATVKVQAAVKRGATILGLAKDFWNVARGFRQVIEALGNLEKIKAQLARDQIEEVRAQCSELYRSTCDVLDKARAKGLTNRTLINGSIQAVRARNEELLDFLDSFELSLDPQTTESLQRTVGEAERGETVSFESLLR